MCKLNDKQAMPAPATGKLVLLGVLLHASCWTHAVAASGLRRGLQQQGQEGMMGLQALFGRLQQHINAAGTQQHLVHDHDRGSDTISTTSKLATPATDITPLTEAASISSLPSQGTIERQLEGGILTRSRIGVAQAHMMMPGAWLGPARTATDSKKMLTCTPEQAATQAHEFRMRSLYESGCAPHIWLPRYQGMMPAGHKIVIDIGCNQGFSSVEFFDMFAPELGVNKRSLMLAHTPAGEQVDKNKCGACLHDCLDVHQTPELLHGHRTVDVHCVEPSNIHFASLVAAREVLFGGVASAESEPFLDGGGALGKTVASTTGVWHLHNMAVSNETGVASFSSDCNTTQCSLTNDTSGYQVQVTTVDDLLQNMGDPPFVTLLKIDTEGFDMNVLAGATKSLQKKVIQMLEFEYNRMNRWQEVNLKDVVDWLETLGYTCYFEGLQYIWKITGTCWHPKYEFRNWSNVVCGPSGGQIELMLDGFSYVRFMKLKAETGGLPDDFGKTVPR